MKLGHLWDLVLLVRCSPKRIEPDATTRNLGKFETTLSCYGWSPTFLCLSPKMTSGSPKPSQCHVTTQKSTFIQRASLCPWVVGREARDFFIRAHTRIGCSGDLGLQVAGKKSFFNLNNHDGEKVREIVPDYGTLSKTTEPMKSFTF